MPISWFEMERNNIGTLTIRLSNDCQAVNTMTTTVMSIKLQNISTIISGLVIGFVFDWRTTLVALGLFPLLILSGLLQTKYGVGLGTVSDTSYKESASLVT